MAVFALVLLVTWLLVVAALPGYLKLRRTGEVGLRVRDRPGSAQWWARLLSTIGFLFAVAAPVAEIAGLPPFAAIDHIVVRLAGVGLVVLGIVITVVSQRAMGASWRGDVDPEVRTELVTTGPFRLVRNPILVGTATTATGLAVMVPNIFSAAMLTAFVIALQIQVRLVEEPYLERVHGDAYRRYATRTGRFLPGIGRMRR